MREKTKKNNEADFKKLSNLSTDCVIIHQDDIITDLNASVIQMFGYNRNELIGANLFESLLLEKHKSLITDSQDETDYYIETELKRKDGTLVQVAICNKKVIYEKEELNVISIRHGKNQTVTEPVIKEKLLTKKLINSLPGIFYSYKIEDQFKLVRWNNNFEKVTGYSHSELINQNILDIFSKEDHLYITREVQKIIKEGSTNIEVNILKKNGGLVQFLVNGQLIEVDNVKYFFGIGIDISELKKTQQNLIKSEKKYRSFLCKTF